MSFPRSRDLHLDLTALALADSFHPEGTPTFCQGDKFLLRLFFHKRTGNQAAPWSTVQLDPGFQIVFGDRPQDDLETGGLLFSATGFAEVGAGDDLHYEALLDLNTDPLGTALTGKKFITCLADVEIQNAANTERLTVPQIAIRVDRQIYRGTEGVPTSGSPPYPSPASIVVKNCGTVAITNGADQVTVTGLGLSAIPAQVLLTLRKPAAGGNLFATVRDASITTDGFIADLSGAADAVGYKLDYLLILP